ncbi:hypothetical protein NKDENANG_00480 [Candidatus Entotheonellaceae bacterium PAL068K]
MSLIDRYIVREFGPFFGIALSVTTFVLVLNKLFRLADLVLKNHLSFPALLRLLIYTLATVSGVILPIAFFIACILTWNRLSADSEYVVLKATGMSLYRMLVPLFVVSIVVYGAANVALMYGVPWGFQGLRRLMFDVARLQAHRHLQPREFHNAFQGLMLYIEDIHPVLHQLEGVFIADSRTTPAQVLTARTGELVLRPETLQVVLRLHDGVIHRYVSAKQRYHLVRFGQYEVRLELTTRFARRARAKQKPRELFPLQLQTEIKRRQAAGEATRPLLIFWHKLFALPWASFVFAGIGPVLGMIHARSGRHGGYVLGLVSIFVYNAALTTSDALGEGTTLPPWFVAWVPNLCMGGLALLVVRRTARATVAFEMPELPTWLSRWRQRWHPGSGQD